MKREMKVVLRGEVQGLDRARAMKNGHHFDTPKNIENKYRIQQKAEQVAQDQGIVLPIPAGEKGYAIVIFARMKPPKSYPKKRLKAIQEGKEHPRMKPDVDNVGKLWLDALVKGGIIEDDKNVTSLTVQKRWAEEAETACLIYWEEEEG